MSHAAIVYQHADHEGPWELGPALRRAGFTVEARLREVRPGDAAADLVVVMGGPMSAWEDEAHPFLAREVEVLRQRLEARRPVIAICLGAQLLARAAGARVHPGEAGRVVGVLPVTLTAQGMADPLFAGFEERFDVVHWHADTWEPVPGSVHLASSARYPQEAFRLGNAWAFQFHPELNPDAYARWIRACPKDLEATNQEADKVLDRDLPRLRAAMRANMLILERVARACAREVGVTFDERFLFTVDSAVRLEGSGVVLAPGIPRREPIIRVGEPILLHRPDHSLVRGVVRGMASFGAEGGHHVPLLVQLEDPDADVPAGTEATTRAPHDLRH